MRKETPNAGGMLAGFLRDAIQEQAAALTPEQEQAGADAAACCGLAVVEAGPGLFAVLGYGRTFYTSTRRADCVAFCNVSGPAIAATYETGNLNTPAAV